MPSTDAREPDTGLDCAVACARAWLGRILEGIGVEAHIEVRRRGGRLIVDARCRDGGSIAIGPQGQTLGAIQLLISRILERSCPGGKDCVLVDVEGYSGRQRHNLVRRARRAADQARESGEAVAMEGLNPFERFLVHDALRADARVCATSEGEGHLRRVVIAPAGDGRAAGQ